MHKKNTHSKAETKLRNYLHLVTFKKVVKKTCIRHEKSW
jgi:hypothetical protein